MFSVAEASPGTEFDLFDVEFVLARKPGGTYGDDSFVLIARSCCPLSSVAAVAPN